MLVGDSTNREAAKVPRQLCFRCEHNMQQQPFGGAPCTGSDTKGFPNKACGGGWRVTVTFPSCWDGKNLDSADHKSHIAYPATGTFESGGACPASHPVKIPQVMYEIMFDTRQFNNKEDWPEDGSQPFVWSMGDPTGYGIHGDYLFGWKGDALQRAMDTKCAGDACRALQRQTDAKAIACTKPQMAKEDIGTDVCMSLASAAICLAETLLLTGMLYRAQAASGPGPGRLRKISGDIIGRWSVLSRSAEHEKSEREFNRALDVSSQAVARVTPCFPTFPVTLPWRAGFCKTSLRRLTDTDLQVECKRLTVSAAF